jgi:ABC-type molybdate transport system substrate-binding protein
MFSAGVHAQADEPHAARALVDFFTAPAAAAVIERSGMQPACRV